MLQLRSWRFHCSKILLPTSISCTKKIHTVNYPETRLHRKKTCNLDSRYWLKSRLTSDWLTLAGDGGCSLAVETVAVETLSVKVPSAALWWWSDERASFTELRRVNANILTYIYTHTMTSASFTTMPHIHNRLYHDHTTVLFSLLCLVYISLLMA